MIYEDITTLIPNTTMQKVSTDAGVHVTYRIKPIDGYALHNSGRDWVDDETGVLHRGYSTVMSTVQAAYDFENTTIIDGYTAYGAKEIFARPIEDIDGETNHIFATPVTPTNPPVKE